MASDIYNTGASSVSNANNQGQNAINSFDPSNFSTDTMSGLNGITSNQDKTQNTYQDAFKNQIASQPTTTQAYQTGQQIYNVQPLQDTANQLNNAVLTAPQNNIDRSKGFNVDAGQIAQQTSQDLARLSPLAIASQNNATTAQQNATNYANLQYEQNQMNILPEQQQGQYLMQQYAAQQTGWTTAQSQQLNALTAKMQSGQQLSSDEMSAYASLSQAEANYQGAIASANAQVEAANIGQQYKTLNPSQTVYNTQTNAAYTPIGTSNLSKFINSVQQPVSNG